MSIGKFCYIGGGTKIILGAEHHPEWVSTYPFRIRFEMEGALEDGQPKTKGNITIGNDVWIGSYTTILSGIQIGDGAIIEPNSMVVKNVPPYAVVGGNPAIVIRKRFTEEEIQDLLEIQWWNWDIRRIKKNIPLLHDNDIGEFIRLAKTGKI